MSKLRVWWIPQLGIENVFYVPIESPEEGKKLLDTLAAYDFFQLQENVKPDFCNTGGVEVFNEETNEWEDWYSDDGEELDDYFEGNEKLENFKDELFSQLKKA